MLTLFADGAESLWDELLPEEVRVLPDDLARLDELLCDPELLAPIAIRWERELAQASRFSDRGRPSLAMETYVRLMVLKHRCGWGYETLMREVSDSIHLRRFCRLGLAERVPDESTVRKLTRRLGAEVVHQLTRELIQKARREKRFRPRAARIDSTVKQYFKEGRALRTETTVNDPYDFQINRTLTAATWQQLRSIGDDINQRLLDAQLQACSCAPDPTTLERLLSPSIQDGQPAPATNLRACRRSE